MPRERRRVTHPPSEGIGANQNDSMSMDQLVAQYKKHGTMPNVPQNNPLYGDFTFPEDIHEIREATLKAEERFGQLPADVRTAAQNDWIKFLEMFNDPEGQSELIEAGLEINSETEPPTNPNTPPASDESPSTTTTPDPETPPTPTG